jgi:hypothetical protein
MRRLAPFAFVVTAVLSMSSIAGAQSIATEQPSQPSPATVVTASVQAPSAGPTLDGATVGIRRDATQSATTPTNATPAVRHGDQSTALMIVGGAAFLAGAIIGGDAGTIIMVGGAAVGLYGLYLYLQ